METVKSMFSGFLLLPPITLYILIGCVALAVVVIMLRLVRKVKFIGEALSDKKYRKNPKSQGLSSTLQTALNVGAINGEQTMFFVDSLTTGRNKTDLKEAVFEYYGINSAESAITILGSMYEAGHRAYFDAICKHFSTNEKPKNVEYYTDNEYVNLSRLKEFHENLEESVEDLIHFDFISKREDISTMSIVAWDMGRIVNVARICFDLGYITEMKAWEIINGAYEESKKAYATWEEFATGYIVGRAMWMGYGVQLEGLMAIARELLSDDDSPWKKNPLKTIPTVHKA